MLNEPGYPKHYAAFRRFSIILGVQVVIMLCRPRSWSPPRGIAVRGICPEGGGVCGDGVQGVSGSGSLAVDFVARSSLIAG